MIDKIEELKKLTEEFNKSVKIRKAFGISNEGNMNVQIIKPIGISPNDVHINNKLIVRISHEHQVFEIPYTQYQEIVK